MPITPDTKNWTWVLERPCPECGFDASTFGFRDVPGMLRANAAEWPSELRRVDARDRPDEATWSPLEYSAHVRDVFRVYRGRFRLMLAEDGPEFPDWDQDAAAAEDRYSHNAPEAVAIELLEEAEALALTLDAVDDADLGRTGLRSDGSAFTVDTLARYFIHDPIHHLHDVRD